MCRFLSILTIISIFACNLEINAQDSLTSIEEEIRNAKESPVITILNSRQLLLSKIKSGENNGVSEILDYLDRSIDTNTYAAFYPLEKVLIDIIIGRFIYIKNSELLDSIVVQMTNKKIYTQDDGLFKELKKLLENKTGQIHKQAKSTGLSELETTFLSLFIDVMVTIGDNRQELLNEKSDSFLKAYPESKFTHFTRNYIRFVYKPSNFGMGFAFFSGGTFMTGNLKNYFSDHLQIGVMFDFYYKNIALYLIDHIGIPSDTKKNFNVGNDTWPKGTAVNLLLPSIELGYQFNIVNRLFVSPFIGISSQSFTSSGTEKNNGIDVSTPWTAAFTAGVNTDIAIVRRKDHSKISMVSKYESAYWTLRIRTGYSDARFESKYSKDFSGGIVFVQIGIGGFARKLKREL